MIFSQCAPAQCWAYLYKLRDKESGGYLWGQSLVFLVLVTPKISMPVGVGFYQPAPELSAWYKTDKSLKKQGVPPKQRPRKPAPNPPYPTKAQRALRLLETFNPRSRSQVEPYDFCSGGEPRYEMRLHCTMMPAKETTTGGAAWQ